MAVSSPAVSGMARAGSAFLAFLFRRSIVSLVSLAVFVTGVFFLVDLLIPYENPAIDPEIPVAGVIWTTCGAWCDSISACHTAGRRWRTSSLRLCRPPS